jgi:hypothetical protein
MNTVLLIITAVICLFFIWQISKRLKENPELLSKENINKSFTTMGILALILIGGVTLLVFLLKHS